MWRGGGPRLTRAEMAVATGSASRRATEPAPESPRAPRERRGPCHTAYRTSRTQSATHPDGPEWHRWPQRRDRPGEVREERLDTSACPNDSWPIRFKGRELRTIITTGHDNSSIGQRGPGGKGGRNESVAAAERPRERTASASAARWRFVDSPVVIAEQPVAQVFSRPGV